MRIAIGLVVMLGACDDGPEMFPVGGGGTDGGNNPLIDGSVSDARLVDATTGSDAMVTPIDAGLFNGRVCLATDPRDLDNCASTGADGLTVRLGSAETVTGADGRFTITAQSGTNLVWRITGANIVTSHEVLADYQIPAITKTMFESMKSTNGVMLVPGEGSLMIEVINNGQGAVAATASVALPNVPVYEPFYDGASAAAWDQDATQSHGAIWLAGLDVGTANVTVSWGGNTITESGQPIIDGGITFTTIVFP